MNAKNKKSVRKQGGFTLIEILVVIGLIAILAGIVLVAINPARQFAQAHNSQRTSNVNAILNAVGQYIADNKGVLPTGLSAVTSAVEIKKAAGGFDLCASIIPTYMPALPMDPSLAGGSVTDCASSYATGYSIVASSTTGRITVAAMTPELGVPISVTR